jgi:hypothetical protein
LTGLTGLFGFFIFISFHEKTENINSTCDGYEDWTARNKSYGI